MSEIAPSTTEYHEQEALLERLLQPQPTVIAIEGGPCGGKSTLLAEIEQQAQNIDRPVVIIPEVATRHITKLQQYGIVVPELAAQDRLAYIQFQQNVLEEIVDRITLEKNRHAGTDAIVVIDRCDIGAYVTPEERNQIHETMGLRFAPYLEHVDQLYYLPSVARVHPEQYEALKDTNFGRYENTVQAAATCEATLRAVHAHPELHVVWGGDFNQNIQRTARGILHPDEEGEIKMEVNHQDAVHTILQAVREGNLLVVHMIEQSYHQLGSQEYRLRVNMSQYGHTSYFLTIKEGDGVLRQEIQRKITKEEYELLHETPLIGNELRKVRYVLLDAPKESSTERRLWVADQYESPQLPVWHFETDAESEVEADELSVLYSAAMQRTTTKAKDLIFIEQK